MRKAIAAIGLVRLLLLMPAHKMTPKPGPASQNFLRRVRWGLLLGLTGVMVLGTVALAQSGVLYDLSWHVFSGGGGPANGSLYQVNYSVGQPSLIDLSGGATYQLKQGY